MPSVRVRENEYFDAALRLASKFRVALFNRGRTKFYSGDYSGAAVDLSAASALKPAEPYTLLWLYLARARSGQAAQDPLRAEAAALRRLDEQLAVWANHLEAVMLDNNRFAGE